jgi:hypothetical protein
MYAVEFHATVKDGAIEIPPEYQQKFKHRVKVILLAEETSDTEPNLIDQLMSQPLQIKAFHPLRRDEANAR